ncbi:MAG: efflux RND transporter periplasmic adaptor subunit [Deferrisomatales bacterium]
MKRIPMVLPLLIALAAGASRAEEAVPVAVAVARTAPVVEAVEGTGTLEAFESAELIPRVGGVTVTEVRVREGDSVGKGQVLVRLDDELVRTRIDGVRARIAAAKAKAAALDARVAMLEADAARFRHLFEQGVSPRQQLDHVEAELKVARAERRALDAECKALEETRRELELRLTYHTLTAPWDGTVVARPVDPGDTASTSRPVLALARLSRLKLRAQVAEVDVPRVQPGQTARGAVDALGRRWFEARVARVLPRLDPATHTGDVEIHLGAEGTPLRPGMFARARIQVGRHEGVALPRDALRKVPGSGVWFAYVVTPDGRAQRRDVRLGESLGDLVEVTAGVAAGEAVVVRGEGVVRTGVAVRVVGRPGESSP